MSRNTKGDLIIAGAALLSAVDATGDQRPLPWDDLVLGFGLNGTSSILYAAVARFAPSERRASTYGYYYTVTEASAIAPVIYGRIADLTNLRATMMVMAAATALILPASLLVRRHLAARTTPDTASSA